MFSVRIGDVVAVDEAVVGLHDVGSHLGLARVCSEENSEGL
jgi:hypothetical protein